MGQSLMPFKVSSWALVRALKSARACSARRRLRRTSTHHAASPSLCAFCLQKTRAVIASTVSSSSS